MASERQKRRFAAILLLDALAAASRIGALVAIAAAIGLFTSQDGKAFLGYHVNVPPTVRSVAAFTGTIAVLTLLGGMATYFSARLSRQFGRAMNEKTLRDIIGFLGLPPAVAAHAKMPVPRNLNTVFTQIPIHAGLAAETLARLVHPLFLVLFTGALLLWYQPLVAIIAFGAFLAFLPLFLRTTDVIRKNARGFYADRAVELGSVVAASITRLSGQHGIVPKSRVDETSLIEAAPVRAFFDSYDINLLANERIGLLLALADSVVRPALFALICGLVFLEGYPVDAAVAFLGGLAYLLGSARSASGLLINLVRYQPQVARYFGLVDAVAVAHSTGAAPGNWQDVTIRALDERNQKAELVVAPGEVGLVLSDRPLSTFTLGSLVADLFSTEVPRDMDRLAFVSGGFRFTPVSVISQLCGGVVDADRAGAARQLAAGLGADRSFSALPNGYETILSEDVWAGLDAAARVALRIVPLAVNASPIVFVDIAAIQSVGEKGWPAVREVLSGSCLFLFVPIGGNPPALAANWYFSVYGGGLRIGSPEWFRGQMRAQQMPETAIGRADLSSPFL